MLLFLTNESLLRRPGTSGPLERAAEAAYTAGLHAGFAWGALAASLIILLVFVVFGRNRGDH